MKEAQNLQELTYKTLMENNDLQEKIAEKILVETKPNTVE